MIPKREILEAATNSNLTPHVIEKDYVLGWIMAGINRHKTIGNSWVFKGGTCLKKCYFETYRFSEDLDFTLRDENHINADFLTKTFSEINEWIYEESGIEITTDRMIFDVYENPRGIMSCQGRLFYKGPCSPRSEQASPRIKLDLSTDEVVVDSPVMNLISHPYSDLPKDGFHIQCYSYEEVFAEKIRALSERTRPRDLYDVINFYRRQESKDRALKVKEILQKKCEFKGITMPTYAVLEKHKDECASGWEQQLSHQLQMLPPFESFWQELPGFYEWLEHPEAVATKTLGVIPQLRTDMIVDEEPIDLSHSGVTASNLSLLDRIRFAATNHLCVELVYRREDGVQKSYLIEPYSLKRTSEGNLLLYSMKHNTSDTRGFRTDRIISANATNITFTPKYIVEFLPVGSSNTEMPISSSRGQRLGVPKRRSSHSSLKLRNLCSSGVGSRIKYTYKCPLCMKNFTRNTMNSRLNPHKNKSGWNCPGRIGMYVKTRY